MSKNTDKEHTHRTQPIMGLSSRHVNPNTAFQEESRDLEDFSQRSELSRQNSSESLYDDDSYADSRTASIDTRKTSRKSDVGKISVALLIVFVAIVTASIGIYFLVEDERNSTKEGIMKPTPNRNINTNNSPGPSPAPRYQSPFPSRLIVSAVPFPGGNETDYPTLTPTKRPTVNDGSNDDDNSPVGNPTGVDLNKGNDTSIGNKNDSPNDIVDDSPTNTTNVDNSTMTDDDNSTVTDDNNTFSCADNSTFTFFNGNGQSVNCTWITKNPVKEASRKVNYCNDAYVKYQCPATCNMCDEECADDPTFQFYLDDAQDMLDPKLCSWIERNRLQLGERRDDYCTERDGTKNLATALGEACPFSCGFCPSANSTNSTHECEEVNNFIFEADNGEEVDCCWITRNQKQTINRMKYCDNSIYPFIREACPLTCQTQT